MACSTCSRSTLPRLGNTDLDDAQRFMLEQAHAQGVCYHTGGAAERKRLERRVKRGELVRPFRGLYAQAEWWRGLDPVQRHVCLARSLAPLHPDWIYCGRTAAAIWGFLPPFFELNTLHVALPGWSRCGSAEGVCFHRVANLQGVEVDGMRLTTQERTAVDCLRSLPFSSALAVADAVVRVWHQGDLVLADYMRRENVGSLRNVSQARMAALLADARSENAGESIARANMMFGGFALPELQVVVPRSMGTASCVDAAAWEDRWSGYDDWTACSPVVQRPGGSYRVDFAWNVEGRAPIYGELDGRVKYADPSMLGDGDAFDALLRERRRESELTLSSSSIVRFSFSEAASPAVLAERLEAFGVPRVCKPLRFSNDSHHNWREVRTYLEANCPGSSRAAQKLALLDEAQWR